MTVYTYIYILYTQDHQKVFFVKSAVFAGGVYAFMESVNIANSGTFGLF